MKKLKLFILVFLCAVCLTGFCACGDEDIKNIEFAIKEVTLTVGESVDTQQILTTSLEDYAISIADQTVAELEGKKVVAKSEGQTVVTVTSGKSAGSFLLKVRNSSRKLETPTGLKRVGGSFVAWDFVTNASGYQVVVNGTTHALDKNTNQIQIPEVQTTTKMEISVIALGDENYENSNSAYFTFTKLAPAAFGDISLNDSTFSFKITNHNAEDEYQLLLDGIKVDAPLQNGTFSYEITRAGKYQFAVAHKEASSAFVETTFLPKEVIMLGSAKDITYNREENSITFNFTENFGTKAVFEYVLEDNQGTTLQSGRVGSEKTIELSGITPGTAVKVKITAIYGGNENELVLFGAQAQKDFTVAQNLAKPQITNFAPDGTITFTYPTELKDYVLGYNLLNGTEAAEFDIISENQDSSSVIVEIRLKNFTLISGRFFEFKTKLLAKANTDFENSPWGSKYIVYKSSAPAALTLDETTKTIGNIANGQKVTLFDNAKNELSDLAIQDGKVVFGEIAPGTYFVASKYITAQNVTCDKFFESDLSAYTKIEKLSMPTIRYDFNQDKLIVTTTEENVAFKIKYVVSGNEFIVNAAELDLSGIAFETLIASCKIEKEGALATGFSQEITVTTPNPQLTHTYLAAQGAIEIADINSADFDFALSLDNQDIAHSVVGGKLVYDLSTITQSGSHILRLSLISKTEEFKSTTKTIELTKLALPTINVSKDNIISSAMENVYVKTNADSDFAKLTTLDITPYLDITVYAGGDGKTILASERVKFETATQNQIEINYDGENLTFASFQTNATFNVSGVYSDATITTTQYPLALNEGSVEIVAINPAKFENGKIYKQQISTKTYRRLTAPVVNFDKNNYTFSISAEENSTISIYEKVGEALNLLSTKQATDGSCTYVANALADAQARTYVFTAEKSDETILISNETQVEISKLQKLTFTASMQDGNTFIFPDNDLLVYHLLLEEVEIPAKVNKSNEFDLSSLAPNQYTFSLYISSTNENVVSSEVVEITAKVRATLFAPANFEYSLSTMTLAWEEVANATGYILKANGAVVYEGDNLSFTLSDLTAGETTFEVVAVGDEIYLSSTPSSLKVVKGEKYQTKLEFDEDGKLQLDYENANFTLLITDKLNINEENVIDKSQTSAAYSLYLKAGERVGNTYYVDGEKTEFTVEKLGVVTNLQVSSDAILSFTETANASSYLVTINSTATQVENGDNVYSSLSVGINTFSVKALGDRVNYYDGEVTTISKTLLEEATLSLNKNTIVAETFAAADLKQNETFTLLPPSGASATIYFAFGTENEEILGVNNLLTFISSKCENNQGEVELTIVSQMEDCISNIKNFTFAKQAAALSLSEDGQTINITNAQSTTYIVFTLLNTDGTDAEVIGKTTTTNGTVAYKDILTGYAGKIKVSTLVQYAEQNTISTFAEQIYIKNEFDENDVITEKGSLSFNYENGKIYLYKLKNITTLQETGFVKITSGNVNFASLPFGEYVLTVKCFQNTNNALMTDEKEIDMVYLDNVNISSITDVRIDGSECLVWDEVLGADSYDVYISGGNLAIPCPDAKCVTGSLEAGTYKVIVVPKGVSGVLSVCAQPLQETTIKVLETIQVYLDEQTHTLAVDVPMTNEISKVDILVNGTLTSITTSGKHFLQLDGISGTINTNVQVVSTDNTNILDANGVAQTFTKQAALTEADLVADNFSISFANENLTYHYIIKNGETTILENTISGENIINLSTLDGGTYTLLVDALNQTENTIKSDVASFEIAIHGNPTITKVVESASGKLLYFKKVADVEEYEIRIDGVIRTVAPFEVVEEGVTYFAFDLTEFNLPAGQTTISVATKKRAGVVGFTFTSQSEKEVKVLGMPQILRNSNHEAVFKFADQEAFVKQVELDINGQIITIPKTSLKFNNIENIIDLTDFAGTDFTIRARVIAQSGALILSSKQAVQNFVRERDVAPEDLIVSDSSVRVNRTANAIYTSIDGNPFVSGNTINFSDLSEGEHEISVYLLGAISLKCRIATFTFTKLADAREMGIFKENGKQILKFYEVDGASEYKITINGATYIIEAGQDLSLDLDELNIETTETQFEIVAKGDSKFIVPSLYTGTITKLASPQLSIDNDNRLCIAANSIAFAGVEVDVNGQISFIAASDMGSERVGGLALDGAEIYSVSAKTIAQDGVNCLEIDSDAATLEVVKETTPTIDEITAVDEFETTGNKKLSFQTSNYGYRVIIENANSEVVARHRLISGNNEISLDNLAAGTYILSVAKFKVGENGEQISIISSYLTQEIVILGQISNADIAGGADKSQTISWQEVAFADRYIGVLCDKDQNQINFETAAPSLLEYSLSKANASSLVEGNITLILKAVSADNFTFSSKSEILLTKLANISLALDEENNLYFNYPNDHKVKEVEIVITYQVEEEGDIFTRTKTCLYPSSEYSGKVIVDTTELSGNLSFEMQVIAKDDNLALSSNSKTQSFEKQTMLSDVDFIQPGDIDVSLLAERRFYFDQSYNYTYSITNTEGYSRIGSLDAENNYIELATLVAGTYQISISRSTANSIKSDTYIRQIILAKQPVITGIRHQADGSETLVWQADENTIYDVLLADKDDGKIQEYNINANEYSISSGALKAGNIMAYVTAHGADKFHLSATASYQIVKLNDVKPFIDNADRKLKFNFPLNSNVDFVNITIATVGEIPVERVYGANDGIDGKITIDLTGLAGDITFATQAISKNTTNNILNSNLVEDLHFVKEAALSKEEFHSNGRFIFAPSGCNYSYAITKGVATFIEETNSSNFINVSSLSEAGTYNFCISRFKPNETIISDQTNFDIIILESAQIAKIRHTEDGREIISWTAVPNATTYNCNILHLATNEALTINTAETSIELENTLGLPSGDMKLYLTAQNEDAFIFQSTGIINISKIENITLNLDENNLLYFDYPSDSRVEKVALTITYKDEENQDQTIARQYTSADNTGKVYVDTMGISGNLRFDFQVVLNDNVYILNSDKLNVQKIKTDTLLDANFAVSGRVISLDAGAAYTYSLTGPTTDEQGTLEGANPQIDLTNKQPGTYTLKISCTQPDTIRSDVAEKQIVILGAPTLSEITHADGGDKLNWAAVTGALAGNVIYDVELIDSASNTISRNNIEDNFVILTDTQGLLAGTISVKITAKCLDSKFNLPTTSVIEVEKLSAATLYLDANHDLCFDFAEGTKTKRVDVLVASMANLGNVETLSYNLAQQLSTKVAVGLSAYEGDLRIGSVSLAKDGLLLNSDVVYIDASKSAALTEATFGDLFEVELEEIYDETQINLLTGYTKTLRATVTTFDYICTLGNEEYRFNPLAPTWLLSNLATGANQFETRYFKRGSIEDGGTIASNPFTKTIIQLENPAVQLDRTFESGQDIEILNWQDIANSASYLIRFGNVREGGFKITGSENSSFNLSSATLGTGMTDAVLVCQSEDGFILPSVLNFKLFKPESVAISTTQDHKMMFNASSENYVYARAIINGFNENGDAISETFRWNKIALEDNQQVVIDISNIDLAGDFTIDFKLLGMDGANVANPDAQEIIFIVNSQNFTRSLYRELVIKDGAENDEVSVVDNVLNVNRDGIEVCYYEIDGIRKTLPAGGVDLTYLAAGEHTLKLTAFAEQSILSKEKVITLTKLADTKILRVIQGENEAEVLSWQEIVGATDYQITIGGTQSETHGQSSCVLDITDNTFAAGNLSVTLIASSTEKYTLHSIASGNLFKLYAPEVALNDEHLPVFTSHLDVFNMIRVSVNNNETTKHYYQTLLEQNAGLQILGPQEISLAGISSNDIEIEIRTLAKSDNTAFVLHSDNVIKSYVREQIVSEDEIAISNKLFQNLRDDVTTNVNIFDIITKAAPGATVDFSQIPAGVYTLTLSCYGEDTIVSIPAEFDIYVLAEIENIGISREQDDPSTEAREETFETLNWSAPQYATHYNVTLIDKFGHTISRNSLSDLAAIFEDTDGLAGGNIVVRIDAFATEEDNITLNKFVLESRTERAFTKLNAYQTYNKAGYITFDYDQALDNLSEVRLEIRYNENEYRYVDVTEFEQFNSIKIDGIKGSVWVKTKLIAGADCSQTFNSSLGGEQAYAKYDTPTGIQISDGVITISSFSATNGITVNLTNTSTNISSNVDLIYDNADARVVENEKLFTVIPTDDYTVKYTLKMRYTNIDDSKNLLSSDESADIFVKYRYEIPDTEILSKDVADEKYQSTIKFNKVTGVNNYLILYARMTDGVIGEVMKKEYAVSAIASEIEIPLADLEDENFHFDAGTYAFRIVTYSANVERIDNINYYYLNILNTTIANKWHQFEVLAETDVKIRDGLLSWTKMDKTKSYLIYVGGVFIEEVNESMADYAGDTTQYMFYDLNTSFEYIERLQTLDIQVVCVPYETYPDANEIAKFKSNPSETLRAYKPQISSNFVMNEGAMKWQYESGNYPAYTSSEAAADAFDFNAIPNLRESERARIDFLNRENVLEFVFTNDLGTSYKLECMAEIFQTYGLGSLENLVSAYINLPAGRYTVKVRRLGNFIDVLNSNYTTELTILTTTNARNVYVNDSYLYFNIERYEYDMTREDQNASYNYRQVSYFVFFNLDTIDSNAVDVPYYKLEYDREKDETENGVVIRKYIYNVYKLDYDETDGIYKPTKTNIKAEANLLTGIVSFSLENNDSGLSTSTLGGYVITRGNTKEETLTRTAVAYMTQGTYNVERKSLRVLENPNFTIDAAGNVTWQAIEGVKNYYITLTNGENIDAYFTQTTTEIRGDSEVIVGNQQVRFSELISGDFYLIIRSIGNGQTTLNGELASGVDMEKVYSLKSAPVITAENGIIYIENENNDRFIYVEYELGGVKIKEDLGYVTTYAPRHDNFETEQDQIVYKFYTKGEVEKKLITSDSTILTLSKCFRCENIEVEEMWIRWQYDGEVADRFEIIFVNRNDLSETVLVLDAEEIRSSRVGEENIYQYIFGDDDIYDNFFELAEGVPYKVYLRAFKSGVIAPNGEFVASSAYSKIATENYDDVYFAKIDTAADGEFSFGKFSFTASRIGANYLTRYLLKFKSNIEETYYTAEGDITTGVKLFINGEETDQEIRFTFDAKTGLLSSDLSFLPDGKSYTMTVKGARSVSDDNTLIIISATKTAEFFKSSPSVVNDFKLELDERTGDVYMLFKLAANQQFLISGIERTPEEENEGYFKFKYGQGTCYQILTEVANANNVISTETNLDDVLANINVSVTSNGSSIQVSNVLPGEKIYIKYDGMQYYTLISNNMPYDKTLSNISVIVLGERSLKTGTLESARYNVFGLNDVEGDGSEQNPFIIEGKHFETFLNRNAEASEFYFKLSDDFEYTLNLSAAGKSITAHLDGNNKTITAAFDGDITAAGKTRITVASLCLFDRLENVEDLTISYATADLSISKTVIDVYLVSKEAMINTSNITLAAQGEIDMFVTTSTNVTLHFDSVAISGNFVVALEDSDGNTLSENLNEHNGESQVVLTLSDLM